MFFLFDSIDQKKIQKRCHEHVFLIFFFNSILPDKYITRRMCEKAVDVFWNLFPIDLLQVKWLKFFFNGDSGDVTFCCSEMGILILNLNNINFDNSFDEDDPDTSTPIWRLAWHKI